MAVRVDDSVDSYHTVLMRASGAYGTAHPDAPTCRVPSFLAKAAVGNGLPNALQVLQVRYGNKSHSKCSKWDRAHL